MFVESVTLLVATLILGGGLLEATGSVYGLNHTHLDSPPPATRLRRSFDYCPPLAVASAIVACSLLGFPFVDAGLRTTGVVAPFEFWDFRATNALDRWQASEHSTFETKTAATAELPLSAVFLLVVWPFGQFSFAVGAALLELCSLVVPPAAGA